MIEPLALQTWIMTIFAGTPEIFLVIALLSIAIMAAYFRMNVLLLFFMLGVFLLMFSGFVASPLLILVILMGGLIIGIVMAKIFAS